MPTYSYTEIVRQMESREDISEALFCFEDDDQFYVERVILAIKALLKREDLTANHAFSISKMLLGLQRMPLRTSGLYVRIELSIELNGEASSYSISIDEDEFRTESGGYTAGPMGSDAYSGPTFEVGKRFRSSDVWMIFDLNWPEVFSELAKESKLTIEDYSDATSLDWEHPDGSIFWEWISSHPQE